MRVHVERDFMRDRFRVWFFDDAAKESFVWRLDGGEWSMEPQDPMAYTAAVAPSLVLSQTMLEGLVRAAEGHVHAQDATVRHLDDAIKVRDRALDLLLSPRVEVSYPGNSPAPEAR